MERNPNRGAGGLLLLALVGFAGYMLGKSSASGGAAGVRGWSAGAGVGATASFPVTDTSHQTLQEWTQRFLSESGGANVTQLALEIVGDAATDYEAAALLHRYVCDDLPFIDDPDGFESLTSPNQLAGEILAGADLSRGLDCDDKALLLAALAINQGIPATVAFLDTNGDKEIDHAIPILTLNGQQVWAEVTLPGTALGWKPPTSRVEALAITRV